MDFGGGVTKFCIRAKGDVSLVRFKRFNRNPFSRFRFRFLISFDSPPPFAILIIKPIKVTGSAIA
jgi:hypothetical protein